MELIMKTNKDQLSSAYGFHSGLKIMNAAKLILALTLLLTTKVFALPSYIAPTDYGSLPLTVDGIFQSKSLPIRICNDASSSFSLIMELSIIAGNQDEEWVLTPNAYDPHGDRCQDFTLSLTPKSTGSKAMTIFIAPCQEGFNSCEASITVSADVRSEEQMAILKREGLVRTNQFQYLSSPHDSPQLHFNPNTNEVRLIEGSRVVIADYMRTNAGLTWRSREISRFDANTRLCAAGENRILALPTTFSSTLYSESGDVISRLTDESSTGCFNPVSSDGLLRLVPNSCSERAGYASGRLEVRSSVTSEWGSVCDDFWDDPHYSDDEDVTLNAQTVCRILGGGAGSAECCASCGQSSSPILLDDVRCEGTENNLFDCPHTADHNCDHSEDVGVRCRVTDDHRASYVAGCPSLAQGAIPFLTCPENTGTQNLTLLNFDDFTRSTGTIDQTNRVVIPRTALGDLEPVGHYYTRSGRLMMIGRRHSMLLDFNRDSGVFSVFQFPIDIKGRLPVAETESYLFSFERDESTGNINLNRFARQNGFYRDKRAYENIPVRQPEHIIPIIIPGETDKLLVSDRTTEQGDTRLTVFLITTENSVIPGLTPLAESTTEDEQQEETTSAQPNTTEAVLIRTSSDGGAITGGFFGGFLTVSIPTGILGVVSYAAYAKGHLSKIPKPW